MVFCHRQSNCIKTERKIYSFFAIFVCPSVILESSCLFSARLFCLGLLGTRHQLAIDGAARISRILAVFGFSSPVLETHQLVYLVLWSHRYTDPNKCFQSHRESETGFQDRGRDTPSRWWWWLLHSEGWWTLPTSVSDLLRPIKTELGVVSRVTTCYKDLVQGLDHHEESQRLFLRETDLYFF